MSEEEEESKKPVRPEPPNLNGTKDTDKAIRPGFRNPPNSRSKAQKNKKKK